MYKTIAEVNGMACNMCEAHVNDAIRNHFKVKKVESSHLAKKTEILSEEPIDEARLKEVIGETGYTVGEVSVETVEKKKFSLFGRK